MPDPPFELPLRLTPDGKGILDRNDEEVAYTDERRNRLVLCVSAHDKLIARIAKLEGACAAIGYANERTATAIASLCRDALADPAMDAVCDGLAKDAGLELTE